MGLPIKVSIPKTKIRSEKGVFSRIFTEYEIHASLSHGHELVVYRRYKQFYLLNNEVRLNQINNTLRANRITLPPFPSKVWDSLNSDIINDRRAKLEAWLRATLMHYSLIPFVAKFLDIQESQYDTEHPEVSIQNLNSDETVIHEFIERINSKVKDRIRTLDEFDWLFFSKRRVVRPDSIVMLIHQIIPLCSESNLGSKAINLLYKLMSVDRNKGKIYLDFQSAIREFVKVSPVVLRKMNLNLHVQSMLHGDSSHQAFHITKILAAHYRTVRCEDLLREVLNYDASALEIFSNWESDSLVVRSVPKINSASSLQWREMKWNDFPGELKIEYRFLNRELELKFELLSFSTEVSKVLTALLDPERRKTWDLKLSSMIEVQEGKLAMVYSVDNSLIDFMVESKIHSSSSQTDVNLISVDYEFSVENSQRCECNISYCIEEVEDYESKSPESDPTESLHSTPELEIDTSSAKSVEIYTNPIIKILCLAKFDQLGSRVFISDVLEEDRTLKDSLMLFKSCIEEDKGLDPELRKVNSYSMLQALQTKSFPVNMNKKEVRSESIGEDITDDVEDEDEDLLNKCIM